MQRAEAIEQRVAGLGHAHGQEENHEDPRSEKLQYIAWAGSRARLAGTALRLEIGKGKGREPERPIAYRDQQNRGTCRHPFKRKA